LYTHHRNQTLVGHDHSLETFIGIRITLNQEATANKFTRHTQRKRRDTITKNNINNVKPSNGTKDIKSTRSPLSPRDSSANDGKRPETPAVAAGPKGKPGWKEGTVRFMLDPERARAEKAVVAEFFKIEEEEYEVEVDVEPEREEKRRRRSRTPQRTPRTPQERTPRQRTPRRD
jgi:CTD kinase subunit beta